MIAVSGQLRRCAARASVVAILGLSSMGAANAMEGGLGAYLLGSRDTLAGVTPGPGTYVTNNFYYLRGEAPQLSISGVAVANPKISLGINKVDIAYFFATQIMGGTPGIVLSVPYASGRISASGQVGGFAGSIKDSNQGFVDLAMTAVLGWHQGHWHYSVSMTVFSPTADYKGAKVFVGPPPGADNLLNFSKNRFAFLPAASLTYLHPTNGIEVSGALSLEASMTNNATDWRTAPILNFEGAVMQHLPNQFAIGVAGYASQQLGEDSGLGPDNFKAIVGARSLTARVFALGPLATWRTNIGGTSYNFKLKYSHEFGARRRFESDIFTAAMGVSF
jgi:hypothetical protein